MSYYRVCRRTETCRTEYNRRYGDDSKYTPYTPSGTNELKTTSVKTVCASCGHGGKIGRYGICNRSTCAHELYRRQRIAAEQAVTSTREARNARHSQLVQEALNHYGLACACCGSTEALGIDHVYGDGKQHREAVKTSIHLWLKSHGYPAGFQTLCARCNTSKGRSFTCALHGYKYLGPEEIRWYFEQN